MHFFCSFKLCNSAQHKNHTFPISLLFSFSLPFPLLMTMLIGSSSFLPLTIRLLPFTPIHTHTLTLIHTRWHFFQFHLPTTMSLGNWKFLSSFFTKVGGLHTRNKEKTLAIYLEFPFQSLTLHCSNTHAI